MDIYKKKFQTFLSQLPSHLFFVSLVFIMLSFVAGCDTYQRIQELKTPRFQAGPESFKGAKSCKECHEEIYLQWENSRHGKATDKWFHESVDAMSYFPTEMVMGKGMCFACHGPEALDEGVSCEVCHGISEGDDIEKMHEEKFSIGLATLRQSEFCGKCHSNIDPLTEHILDGALFEWQESPAAKENIQCANCHMSNENKEMAFHGFDGKYFETSLKLHKVDMNDNELSVVLENTNTAHSLPTGNASNVYLLSATILDENNEEIAHFSKEIKKKYAMSFRFPSELITDKTLKAGEIREITFSMSDIDKKQIRSINVNVSHLEVDLNDDGKIQKIHRRTPRLEKNFELQE
jgi:hypothetical protein